MSVLGRAFKAALLFFGLFLCLSVLGGTLAVFHFWLFLRLPARSALETKQFFIPPKTSALGVIGLLESHGVVRDARAFYLLGWLRNSLHRLQAGEYAFSTLSTPEQVLDQIVNGRVVIYSATLPEGSTMWDVARILEQSELIPGEEILRAARSADVARSLGVEAQGLEGYLFPETYRFKKPIDAPAVVKAMVQQFRHHLPEEWEERAQRIGLDLHQIVTLASIIEKEAVVDSERAIIAGVFYNRLKIRMPLQSDPTAVYDLPGFSGPVTSAHLARKSPYNTYHIKGLPPGPICNPGARSLRAAFFPARVPYLYFVSNNDGTHSFSATADEHRRAVAHYHRQKRRAAEEKEEAGSLPAGSGPEPDGAGILERGEGEEAGTAESSPRSSADNGDKND